MTANPHPHAHPPVVQNRRRRRPAHPSPPVIPQSLLAEYRDLTALLRERQQLRDQIFQMLELGATVEMGPLSAQIREVQSCTLSAGKLTAILGEERVEELKQQVESTVSRQLVVGEDRPSADSRVPRMSSTGTV